MKALMSLALLTVLAAPVTAQGWIEPPLALRCLDCAVVRTRTTVSVHVTGRIARVQVDEWFQNRGAPLAQGDYLYPLPGEAVFSNFSLYQGDQEMTGETMDASQARSIYEEIVRKKRDPALIELVGHGLVRARVFPIAAGETRKISLRYTQVLGRAGDAMQFRYTAGRVSDGSWQTHPGVEVTRPVERAPFSLELVADSALNYRDPFSPTHELNVSRAQGRITVRPRGDVSGDLALFLPLARGLVGLTAAMHRPSGEDGYFMLTLSPGHTRGEHEPRDITAVVDISGSMSGTKIVQARTALRQLLSSLNRADRFRLISFNGSVMSYRPDWTTATAGEVGEAQHWVDGLNADGGTNISGALTEAFRAASPAERLPIVVFLTDGMPSVGEQNPERIASLAEATRGRARVFAFGVGFDVNTYLLDRLTAAARGGTQYVQAEGEVESALGNLITKISEPVLTDLAIAGSPARFSEVYPAQLPDLFAGEELVVFGRYAPGADRTGPLTITGRRNGRTEQFSVDVTFPRAERANDFIPRLWASRKVGVLTRTIKLEGPNPRIEQEIRETALRYGILSEYTSYLVQEPVMATQNGPRDRVLPAAAPARSGQGAVQGATEDSRLRAAKSMAALDEAMSVTAERKRKEGDANNQVVQVAGRLFQKTEHGWTDGARHDTSIRTVEIEPYSAAYFQVLEALPELKAYLSRLDTLELSGVRVRLGFKAGGARTISAADLATLVADYRGR